MAEFTPISPPYSIYSKDGGQWHVVGWVHELGVFTPVVAETTRGGAFTWTTIHGEDPWYPSDPT